jgi:integrase
MMARKKARGNGTGTVYPRKNKQGKITGYLGSYVGPDRKRRYVSGKTKRACERALRAAMSDADKGLVYDAGNLTVGAYMNRWLETSANGTLSHRTYHNYELQIRQHINPAIGSMRLSKLTAAHVQSLYASKLQTLKPSSVRYIHAVLHRALDQAVKWNLIPINPAANVDPPKVRQEEITPLNQDQARVFLEAARGDRLEVLYVVSLTCGLRCGEALGLKWSDIDLDKGTLRVNRQVQRKRGGGGLVFSEPKNSGRRTIDLPQRALEALRSHRKQQLEEARGDALQRLRSRFRYRQGHPPRRPEHRQPPLQAAAQARGSPTYPLARPQTHLRHPAAGSGRPP